VQPATCVPPFPAGYRASGVLLHVTSLPSNAAAAEVILTAIAKAGCRTGQDCSGLETVTDRRRAQDLASQGTAPAFEAGGRQ